MDHANSIEKACQLVSAGRPGAASQLLASDYPFKLMQNLGRSYSPRIMTGIFVRDGFIDRYRGGRLVFPAALRLLSHYLPVEFPFHKNWKMSECHVAYWELCPTIDHVQPVARGGANSEDNWVSCSMLTNSIKANWTMAELHWELQPPGRLGKWDGLVGWFMRQVEGDLDVLEDTYIKRWYSAARHVIASQGLQPTAYPPLRSGQAAAELQR